MEIKTPLAQVGKAAEPQTRLPAWVGRRTQTSKLWISSFDQLVYFLSFKSAFGGAASRKTMFSIHYQISIVTVALWIKNSRCLGFSHPHSPPLLHPQVTLQYLWEKEYQVLVFYHHPMALEVPFLWPGQMMPSPWANTTDPEKLIQFLQASVTDRRSASSSGFLVWGR